MSTNYYAFGLFPGGNTDEGLHIGQTAAGWQFLHASHPQLGLTTYKAWHEFLRRPGVTVRSEYGYEITPDEMHVYMTERRNTLGQPLKHRFGMRTGDRLHDGDHIDPDGYAFHEGYFH